MSNINQSIAFEEIKKNPFHNILYHIQDTFFVLVCNNKFLFRSHTDSALSSGENSPMLSRGGSSRPLHRHSQPAAAAQDWSEAYQSDDGGRNLTEDELTAMPLMFAAGRNMRPLGGGLPLDNRRPLPFNRRSEGGRAFMGRLPEEGDRRQQLEQGDDEGVV